MSVLFELMFMVMAYAVAAVMGVMYAYFMVKLVLTAIHCARNAIRATERNKGGKA